MLPAVFVTTPPPASSHPPHAVRRYPAASDLYSLRARRRFASYLRLRLFELREERLERAAAVVEGRLPVDVLVPHLRETAPPR